MKTIIKYILLTALRDWLFLGLIIAIFFCLGLAMFTGGTALTEQENMALVLFAGGVRFILAIGFIVFICFHIRRAFETKEIESILSKPISRFKFILGYFLGFTILEIIAVIIPFSIIFTFHNINYDGFLAWTLSLILELSIISAFSLLTAFILSSATSAVMANFAFYFVCRLMGFFLIAIYNPNSLAHDNKFSELMLGALKIISSLIPRLDLFAKSDWLIYGINNNHDWWLFTTQAGISISLIISMAFLDIRKKEF